MTGTMRDFVSFFNCRPEKWGPGSQARYGVSGPRFGRIHEWKHGRHRIIYAAGYSKRRPMRMRRRYLDTRHERGWRWWQAALSAIGARARAEIDGEVGRR